MTTLVLLSLQYKPPNKKKEGKQVTHNMMHKILTVEDFMNESILVSVICLSKIHKNMKSLSASFSISSEHHFMLITSLRNISPIRSLKYLCHVVCVI